MTILAVISVVGMILGFAITIGGIVYILDSGSMVAPVVGVLTLIGSVILFCVSCHTKEAEKKADFGLSGVIIKEYVECDDHGNAYHFIIKNVKGEYYDYEVSLKEYGTHKIGESIEVK